eukprot:scaffold6786_cov384-Prasinococcus_capsulatus_cf.AAC.2
MTGKSHAVLRPRRAEATSSTSDAPDVTPEIARAAGTILVHDPVASVSTNTAKGELVREGGNDRLTVVFVNRSLHRNFEAVRAELNL